MNVITAVNLKRIGRSDLLYTYMSKLAKWIIKKLRPV